MQITQTLYSYLPSFFVPSKDAKCFEDKKMFETLLRSSETEKTRLFILEHPELINETLNNSNLKPIELSVRLKKATNIKLLMAAGAQINATNDAGITPLENMILMNDPKLLKGIFGNILGNIFNKSQNMAEAAEASNLNYIIMPEAKRQLEVLQEEIHRYQDLSAFKETNNLLIQSIAGYSTAPLQELLTAEETSFSNKEIFDATIYSILSLNNDALEQLYLSYGSKILTLQTTDFKNLFHIAAIANNVPAIEKLAAWGLTTNASSSSNGNTAICPSPFHFAIMHPTLNTFTALIKANISIPNPVNINLLNPKGKIPTFNPFQLLVFRANLMDPLPKGSTIETAYLLLEAALLASKYIDNPIPRVIKDILNFVRTCFFVGHVTKAFAHKNYSSLPITLTRLAFFTPVLLENFPDEIYSTLKFFFWPAYRVLAPLLMVKKVWDDFASYQNAYLYRPGKTLWTFTKDMFTNFLFVKNTFYDPSIGMFREERSKDTKINLNPLKEKLKLLHPRDDILPCVKKGYETAYTILSCLENKGKLDMGDLYLSGLMDNELEQLVKRGLLVAAHPDACARKWKDDKKLYELCEKISTKISKVLNKEKHSYPL